MLLKEFGKIGHFLKSHFISDLFKAVVGAHDGPFDLQHTMLGISFKLVYFSLPLTRV